MPFKMSAGEKQGEGALFKTGNRARIKEQGFAVFLQQMGRKDHIADPQGRGERLGKRIQVNHPLLRVKALQGGNRLSRKTELTVIVVLDDITVRARRP